MLLLLFLFKILGRLPLRDLTHHGDSATSGAHFYLSTDIGEVRKLRYVVIWALTVRHGMAAFLLFAQVIYLISS